jgi:hypothetical protein
MNDAKYIGLDVHQATISVAVLDSAGKLVMEAILETKAETILQFIHGLRGSLRRESALSFPREWIRSGDCLTSLLTDGKGSVRGAQAACCFRCSASKPTPFFQTIKVMAAILRARVRRAIDDAVAEQFRRARS